MKRLQSALLIAAIAVPSAAPVSAARVVCTPYTSLRTSAAGTTVAQICYNARPVPAIRTLVTPPNGTADSRAVNKNWAVPPGTSIAVPDATYIDLVDARAAFRSSAGMRITVAEKGYEVDGAGRVQFAVARLVGNSLDFFAVKVGRFIAAVPGTVFRVDLTDPTAVTFSVSEGRVAVTREVSVHLDRENRNVEGIVINAYLTPNDPPLTYGRAPELLRSFRDVAAARSTFTKDLESAQQASDPILTIVTRRNLDVLNASGPPRRHFAPWKIIGAAAAAAALGLILSGDKPGPATPTPTLTPRERRPNPNSVTPAPTRAPFSLSVPRTAKPSPTPTPPPWGLR
ncbi:MAG TPA: hypothetical protein VGC72_14380 [Candidatus Elarobacter sp.]|jgi:hypothetical protein